ncbi:Histidine phosphatase superfamily clade-1 [Macrophomina phaseolina MS6]|uniref:Histidine phosphatase superfamily clade-1 n=1 Tax=Macrophomina phaseolina (strain MS6) TaxID=1126212 RepID=K2S6R3_MACPH|nr:Histidine phosphatase superfamily clade-1 [Macrophomina phaseolina MS6]
MDSMLAGRTRETIMKWLSPPDHSTCYERAIAGIHPTSGTWFLTSKELRRWIEYPRSLLWFSGIAGCGKTCLPAAVVRRYWNRCLYFFFDFPGSSKQTLEQLLRSLISQIYKKKQMKESQFWLKKKKKKTTGHMPDYIHKPWISEVQRPKSLLLLRPSYYSWTPLSETEAKDALSVSTEREKPRKSELNGIQSRRSARA